MLCTGTGHWNRQITEWSLVPLLNEPMRKVSVPILCIVIKSLKELPRRIKSLRSTVRGLETRVYRFPSKFEIRYNPSIKTHNDFSRKVTENILTVVWDLSSKNIFAVHWSRFNVTAIELAVLWPYHQATRVLFSSVTREIIYKYFSFNRPVVFARGR